MAIPQLSAFLFQPIILYSDPENELRCQLWPMYYGTKGSVVVIKEMVLMTWEIPPCAQDFPSYGADCKEIATT